MAGSSQSASASGSWSSLAAIRDADGYLPLVHCSKCGTRLIGRFSQQPRSMGKRFYKCPKLEHFYMMEEHYVDYLATYEVLLGGSANVSGLDMIGRDLVKEANEMVKEANGLLTAAIDAVERRSVQYQ